MRLTPSKPYSLDTKRKTDPDSDFDFRTLSDFNLLLDDKYRLPCRLESATNSRELLSTLHTLKCFSLNARSISKNGALDSLHKYMLSEGTHVGLISETWLSPDSISDAEIGCDGNYSVYRLDRKSRGGGVAILVKSSLPSCAVDALHAESDLELVAVDLLDEVHPIRIICVYFSPTGTASELIDRMKRLCATIETLSSAEITTCIAGDFNLPNIDWVVPRRGLS